MATPAKGKTRRRKETTGSVAQWHKKAMATADPEEAYLCLIAVLEKYRETLRDHDLLVDLVERYRDLTKMMFFDIALKANAFRANAPSSKTEPHWPSTEIIESNIAGRLDGGVFGHEVSALYLCGYRVGKLRGLAPAARIALLRSFYTSRLNPRIDQLFPGEYGDPNSMQRLLKMANVIAANCRDFKRQSNTKSYAVAIADYEADLAILKRTYFDPLVRGQRTAVDWPSTDIEL